ncbi:hypothetical protein [Rheinheimera gaetbuli]
MEYSYFLLQVGNYTWLAYILAFVVVFKLGLADRSYCFGVAVLIVSNLIMQVVEPGLVALSSYHKELVRQLWYPTWASFALISIYAINLLHKKTHCSIGFVSKSIVYAFCALGLLQFLRYFDYLVLQTNALAMLYRYGVNAINIGAVIILLAPVFTALTQKLKAIIRTKRA